MTGIADLMQIWRRDWRRSGRGTSHPGRTVVLIGCVLAFTLLGLASWLVLDRRATELAAADHEFAALAVALAEQTSLGFGAVDADLREIQQWIRVAGIASLAALEERMGTFELQQRLHDQIAGLSQIDVVGIVGADGRMIDSSREWPVVRSSFTNRDFFPALRDDPSLGAFISKPAKSQATGRLLLVLSRRISAPDGGFIGIVLGAIWLDYFANLYHSVSEGEERVVALRRRDGSLLARYPQTNEPLGDVPATDELFMAIRRGAQTSRSLSRSPTDGMMRLRNAQAVQDFPLVVVVARTEESILTDWRRQSAVIGGGAALGAAALLMATALLARQIARREDSEAALAATLEHMSQGIMMIDGDRRVPVYNMRALEILDIPPELMASKPLFDDILRFQSERGEFGPDGTGFDDATRRLFLAGGVSAETDSYERRRPNGTILEISSIPLHGGGVVRTYTDVTATREREAALQAALRQRDKAEAAFPEHRDNLEREMADRARPLAASEARHRDVAEVASDWIWETDAKLRLAFVSKRFGDTSGIAWASVVGIAFGDLVALGFDRDGMDQLRATIGARGTFQNVIHRVVPAGDVAHFWRMSGRPFADTETGAFAGYRGTGTDVTVAIEHAAALNATVLRAEVAEREARHSCTRLVEAIEAIPEGFILFDAEDRLVMCNASYADFYPLTADLLIAGARYEDVLRASAMRGEHMLKGSDIDEWLAERLTRHFAKTGNREEQHLANGRWLQAYERHTSDGGTVGIHIDVTEARLREGAEREREKLAALGQLAGGVAHEINNLLQPAITLPEMVRDRLPPDDLESREDLDCVVEGARKVREIVRNILLFARKEDPRLVPLDLAVELRAAIGFVRGLMPPSISVCEENLEAHLGCRVAANKTQLTQVLTNLLVNAAQATKGTGTVTVSVSTTQPTAEEASELSVEPGRSYLAVSVADTGSGMDAATQAHIFEPFFTTKPIGQGTGLGLSVVYGILRSWGGAIMVRSALGQGTTFILHVPLIGVAEA